MPSIIIHRSIPGERTALPSPEKKYRLATHPGESFSDHQLMCLIFAGFKRIAPDQDTGMDLNEPSIGSPLWIF